MCWLVEDEGAHNREKMDARKGDGKRMRTGGELIKKRKREEERRIDNGKNTRTREVPWANNERVSEERRRGKENES